MKTDLELSSMDFRNTEAALRCFERAQARGEIIIETRELPELYTPRRKLALTIRYMRLALAEKEGA